MDTDPDEPPPTRQITLDVSTILIKEVMVEFKGFQTSMEQRLDSAIVLSKEARELAETSRNTSMATQAQVQQLG